MNALQRSFQAIGTQVGSLPATAKLLIGSLMVILVMSLLLVAQFAGRASMVPLPINLDPDGRDAARAYLERAGVAHEERDGRLLVPAEQKYTVLASLTDQEVITGDQINFDSLIEQDSPFLTRDQTDRRWMIAKMNVLSAMISRFNGIRRATVVMDKPRTIGFGATAKPPTASVNVEPAGDGLSQDQVEAIAHLVAGSQPGLDAADVKIIDAKSGQHHQARRNDRMTAGTHLEVKRAAEKHVKTKIEELLSYIPGVRVAVNAMVDTREVEQRTDAYEDPKIGPLQSSRRTIESTSTRSAAEPGVRPNTGVRIASSGRGSTLTDESSSESTEPKFPRDAAYIKDPKGYALKINATIEVPRSYFVGKFRLDTNNPEAAPDDSTLDPVVVAETARLRAAVEPLVDTSAFRDAVPGTVVVSMIPDFAAAVTASVMPGNFGGGGGGAGGGGVPVPFIGADLLKYLALGGLTLLSLAMMLLMVRRTGGRGPLPTAEDIVGVPPPLPTDSSEVVGEAEESAPAMEGLELDDETLRRKQMLSQISDMVKQNPDEVANLLRRWIRVEA